MQNKSKHVHPVISGFVLVALVAVVSFSIVIPEMKAVQHFSDVAFDTIVFAAKWNADSDADGVRDRHDPAPYRAWTQAPVEEEVVCESENAEDCIVVEELMEE